MRMGKEIEISKEAGGGSRRLQRDGGGKVKVETRLLSIDISLVVIYQTALVVWFS